MKKPETIGGILSYLSRAHQISLAKKLEPYHIGMGGFFVLMALYRNDGINQEMFARDLGYDKATIARAIRRLEEEGYVARERNPDDRRAYRIRLSGRGRSIEKTMRQVASEWDEMLVFGFVPHELSILRTFLHRMTENVVFADQGAGEDRT
jgi:DNA-binding MarR family transcriptional regulator